MSKDFAEIAHDVVAGVGLLQRGAPDTMKAFGSFSTAATAAKAIDTKTKELMALAIGIAVHCDGCVAYHTKKWLISMALGVRRLPRRLLSPSTWVVDPRRCTAEMR
jgi:alkylhydroperoxidase/carboxymuconolactone decarboxylase family protein YurZ